VCSCFFTYRSRTVHVAQIEHEMPVLKRRCQHRRPKMAQQLRKRKRLIHHIPRETVHWRGFELVDEKRDHVPQCLAEEGVRLGGIVFEVETLQDLERERFGAGQAVAREYVVFDFGGRQKHADHLRDIRVVVFENHEN